MIERNGSAGAHEFLHADFDNAVTAVVLEVGNVVAGHIDLRML
jgi:CheY-specific phosphatase CheX